MSQPWPRRPLAGLLPKTAALRACRRVQPPILAACHNGFRPPKCDREIASLDKAGFPQSLAKSGDHASRLAGRSTAEKSDHRHRRLLRARCQRPRCCRAADQCDELATPHVLPHRGITPYRAARGNTVLRANSAAIQRTYLANTAARSPNVPKSKLDRRADWHCSGPEKFNWAPNRTHAHCWSHHPWA